jgi:hypothetical protein
VEQGFRLRQDAELVRRDDALDRDRAQVEELEGGIVLEQVGGCGLEQVGEHRLAGKRAEKDLLAPRGRALQVRERQQRGGELPVAAQDRDLARDCDGPRRRLRRVAGEEVLVALGAVAQERVAYETETIGGGGLHARAIGRTDASHESFGWRDVTAGWR